MEHLQQYCNSLLSKFALASSEFTHAHLCAGHLQQSTHNSMLDLNIHYFLPKNLKLFI